MLARPGQRRQPLWLYSRLIFARADCQPLLLVTWAGFAGIFSTLQKPRF